MKTTKMMKTMHKTGISTFLADTDRRKGVEVEPAPS